MSADAFLTVEDEHAELCHLLQSLGWTHGYDLTLSRCEAAWERASQDNCDVDWVNPTGNTVKEIWDFMGIPTNPCSKSRWEEAPATHHCWLYPNEPMVCHNFQEKK